MLCPSCHGPLRPAVLACDACNLRIEGNFQRNEFASLDGDDLHLLRIFIHTEGRIRDMEAALGLSYPTIKSRLAALRAKLLPPQFGAGADLGAAPPPTEAPEPAPAEGGESPRDVLRQLEAGQIPFQEAVKRIRQTRRGSP
jgi:hypothetical protein